MQHPAWVGTGTVYVRPNSHGSIPPRHKRLLVEAPFSNCRTPMYVPLHDSPNHPAPLASHYAALIG